MQSSIPASAPLVEPAPPTPAQELWRGLKLNRGAMIGLGLLAFFTVLAVLAPVIAEHRPETVYPEALRLPPFWKEGGSFKYPLGTDDLGRDLFSRLIYGSQVSLSIGAIVVLISATFGTLLGLIAGYVGGWVDTVLMRLTDLLMALPSMLLAIVVVTLLGPGLFNAIVAVSLVSVPSFVRLVRASVLKKKKKRLQRMYKEALEERGKTKIAVLAEKQKTYVAAVRSFGASHTRVLFSNIFPNTLAPLIVQGTLGFSDGILNVAALGFLGLGAQPPTAEWGTMLADARPFIESAPWLVTLPGLCILLVVLAFNLMGDGLRDALDPRLKK